MASGNFGSIIRFVSPSYTYLETVFYQVNATDYIQGSTHDVQDQ